MVSVRTWLSSVIVSLHSGGRRSGSLKGWVDRRCVLEWLAGGAWGVDARREGWFVGHVGDGHVGATTEHLGLVSVGVGSGSGRVHRRRRAGGRLDGSRAGGSLEDGIVAQTLALRLLAVAAGGVLFVTLVRGEELEKLGNIVGSNTVGDEAGPQQKKREESRNKRCCDSELGGRRII